MNVWQGTFPTKNTNADGYYGTCPVDAYSRKAGAAAWSVVRRAPTDPTSSRRAIMLAERACADNHSSRALGKRWYGRYGRQWSPVWVMGVAAGRASFS
jgi:hypothetical protein